MFESYPPKPLVPPQELADIYEAPRQALATVPDAAPPTLFHYTNAAGLLGIIESGKMRATHIGFMNDASEYLHAVALLLQEVERKIPAETDPLKKAALNDMRVGLQPHANPTYPPLFICCFSEAENSLNQWRAYSRGEGGFSIGFETNDLRDQASFISAYIWPVIYDPRKQIAFISTLLNTALAEYAKAAATYPPAKQAQHRENWLRMFALAAAPLAPLLKYHSFYEEREWRIIYVLRHMTELQFLPKPTSLSTYVDLDLAVINPMSPTPPEDHMGRPYTFPKRLPVQKLWMGPGYLRYNSKTAAKALLERNGYFGVDLSVSEIPFRVG